MWLPVVLAALSMGDVAPDREIAVIDACSAWQAQRPSDGPTVHKVGEDGICFFGNTMGHSSSVFVEVVSAINPETPLVVVVRSGGGEINAAMAMGEALVPRQTTVVVQSMCASSCANYLFLAGDRRVVLKGALLAYHGGMYEQPEDSWVTMRAYYASDGMDPGDIEASVAATRTYVTKSLARQEAFLRSVEVNPDLFEWMQDLNALSAEEKRAACPGEGAGAIVFSDAALAKHNIIVHQNDGPTSVAELATALEARGSPGLACYWA